VLLRLGVVVAEYVQHAVHAQQVKLGLRAVLGLGCLRGCDLRAEHHVAEQAGIGAGIRTGARLRWPQFVHREREHVGGTRLPHPSLMQLGHRRLVHQQHGELGQRVDAKLVEREPGHGGEPGLVHVHTRLVRYVYGHFRLPVPVPLARGSPVLGFTASYRSYASTIFPTSRCLTTSWLVSRAK
jgi:hypothetical protein